MLAKNIFRGQRHLVRMFSPAALAARQQRTPIAEKLKTDMVIMAEGFVFELERRGYLQMGPWVPIAVVEEPEVVKQLHRETVRSGTDVILACTYYAHEEKLRLIGRSETIEDLNRKAIQIAHEINAEFDNRCYIAGNISNSNVYDANAPGNEERVRKIFRDQIEQAKDEGVEFILGETFSWYGEALLANDEIIKAGLPSIINIALPYKSLYGYDKTHEGYTLTEIFLALESAGACCVGLNCWRGPDQTIPLLLEARDAGVKIPLSAIPMIYRTTEEHPTVWTLTTKSETHFKELEGHLATRVHMKKFTEDCQKSNQINLIGVCCGGWVHHVREMAEALGRTVPASRFSPDMDKHFMLGSDETLSKSNQLEGLGGNP